MFKNIHHPTIKKVILILAVIVGFAIIINVGLLLVGIKTHHFQRWAGQQCFGKVTELRDGAMIIQGKDGTQKTVLVTEKTVVRKGPHAVRDSVQAGDAIMVVGPEDQSGQINAQLIRVFDPRDPKGAPPLK